jgi:hypothetical protein
MLWNPRGGGKSLINRLLTRSYCSIRIVLNSLLLLITSSACQRSQSPAPLSHLGTSLPQRINSKPRSHQNLSQPIELYHSSLNSSVTDVKAFQARAFRSPVLSIGYLPKIMQSLVLNRNFPIPVLFPPFWGDAELL